MKKVLMEDIENIKADIKNRIGRGSGHETVLEYKYRFINGLFVFFIVLYFSLFCYIPFSYFKGVERVVVLSIYLLLVYLFLYLWFNIYYFLPDGFILFKPFQFRKKSRIRFVPYNMIEQICYVHSGLGSKNPVIVFKINRCCSIKRPNNELYVLLFKRRALLLKFLASKGISIEIKADTKKDREILN